MKNIKNFDKFICLYVSIAFLALISRLYYISEINFWNFGHDVRIRIFGGHSDYIRYLVEHNFHLPDFNPTTIWQFYHPPLHHYISAIWAKFASFFGGYNFVFESLQILTTIYSILILLFIYLILKSLNYENKSIVFAYILSAFLPSMTLLAGNLNNDILCLLFCTIAIWRVIELNKNFNVKNTILVALFCGLATMTKLSGMVLIPPIFILFLYKILRKNSQKLYILNNSVIFSIIYFPMACAWGIRNYLKWKVPFFYVNPSGSDKEEITNFLSDRIFNITIEDFLQPLLQISAKCDEYNVIEYLLKSSIFSEYNFELNFLTYFIFYASIMLLIWLLGCICFMFVKRASNLGFENKLFLGSLIFVLFAAYVKFQYDYPIFCSQHFRYLAITMIVSAIACCDVIANCKNKIIVNQLKGFILAYSIISLLFFALCTPKMV